MIRLCRFPVALRLKLAATIAVTTATLVLATSSPAYAQAARIDNISPAAARSGEAVTINGRGFGALNVRVAVGGLAAELLAANGNQVTFRVPDGVPPGATLVTAMNPGGRTGTIAFRMLEGIRLSGNPNTLAINATFDLPPVGVNETQIENGVIMTRLDVRLAPGASVEQLNAALQQVDGGIVTMTKGLPFITIAVPRAPSVAALEQTAQLLRSTPGILWASVGGPSESQVLPLAASGFTNRNLLPTRFPAAWNAMQLAVDDPTGNNPPCDSRKVPVLVADTFTRGALPASYVLGFNNEILNPGHFRLLPLDSIGNGTHGYDVTTTLAGFFNDTNPTGANPFTQCLDITGIQTADLLPSQEMFVITKNFPAGQRFILNYSRAFRGKCNSVFDFSGPTVIERCEDGSVGNIATAYGRAKWAEEWKKRTFNQWDNFLATPAAGNFRADPANPEGLAARVYPGLGIARFASFVNIVTDADPFFGFISNTGLWQPTLPDPSLIADPSDVADLRAAIIADGLDQIGRADNVLMTGSTTPGSTFLDLIESNFSNTGPDVAAVGENIVTLGRLQEGTSFAAPQVAGLASYLWLLSDDLRNNQPVSVTRQAIILNAQSLPLAGLVIDAYATVLSLDRADIPSPSTAPVRFAILDLNNDGVFDDKDVSAFLGLYLDSSGKPITDPALRDYDRFDLNGDGFTGGSHPERFDLDRIGSTQYGHTDYAPDVTEQIEGQTVHFNENALTDLNVLCYYAYSALYTGDPAARTTLLPACHVKVAVAPKSTTLAKGATQPFTATVTGTTDQRVTWTASGGTITTAGLFTAGNTPGTFTVRATSVADPTVFDEATVGVNGAPVLSNVFIQTGGGVAPPGQIRAGIFATGFDLTVPIGNVDTLLAQLYRELAGVEIGQLTVQLIEPVNLSVSVGDVHGIGITAGCGSNVSVAAGNVRRNAAQPSSGQGDVVIVACNANVQVAAGAVDSSIGIFRSESSTIDVTAASSGSVNVGLSFGTPNHAVKVSVAGGATLGSSVTSCLECTVAITGVQQSLFVNLNQDLSLHTEDVLGDVTITQNSMPRGLAPIVIGDIAGKLTITNNHGVSNTDAHAFADGRTVVGAVTISGNTP